MLHRFYLPESLGASTVQLTGSEAHHLLHVLRMQVGQNVALFNGCGIEATARIEQTSKRSVTLQILSTRVDHSEPSMPITLAAAVPKGDRFRWLIEKATELGVQRLIPLKTMRSVIDPHRGKLDKMRAVIIAASKQCGRSTLMELAEPIGWTDFVARELAHQTALVAHPTGQPWDIASHPIAGPAIVAVGPEGGFTDAEIDLAREAGAMPVSLGPRTLRIETAAIAMMVLCTTAAGSGNDRVVGI